MSIREKEKEAEKERKKERTSQTDWFERDSIELEQWKERINHIDPELYASLCWTDELDQLLEQLQTLERRLDQQQMNEKLTANYRSMPKPMSPSLTAQFDELDQALATLTNTLNNVEIELADSGNSSSSSGMSDSTTTHQNRSDEHVDRQKEVEGDEHFSDSGLSHSTESISLPYKTSSQLRTISQLSNTSSVSQCRDV